MKKIIGMAVRTDTPKVENERSTTNVHLPLWMFITEVKRHTNVYVGVAVRVACR
ncbi:MAG: hypothetical protein F6K62_27270 [Sphaerospermopsis sp. SIO1G2]|nr:hypothetical protein [Sphaerospermopsis sp. SIO1G2]